MCELCRPQGKVRWKVYKMRCRISGKNFSEKDNSRPTLCLPNSFWCRLFLPQNIIDAFSLLTPPPPTINNDRSLSINVWATVSYCQMLEGMLHKLLLICVYIVWLPDSAITFLFFGSTDSSDWNNTETNGKRSYFFSVDSKLTFVIRPYSLYSMVDGFRQGFFWLVGKKKNKNEM